MSKIHVLPDKNLGGVLREYVEVGRKAKIGEKIVIVRPEKGSTYEKGDIFTVEKSYENHPEFEDGVKVEEDFYFIYHSEYHTLEPTDIVRIKETYEHGKWDYIRYRLVDRKAKVGDKIIIVKNLEYHDWFKIGEIAIVEEVDNNGNVFADFNENKRVYDDGKWCVGRNYYRVLEPVEPAEEGDDVLTVDESEASKSVIDLLANLARRVTELERQQKENREYIIKAFESISGKDDEWTVEERVAMLERTFTEYMRRVNTIEADIEELNTDLAAIEENVEMALDDIVTLDERTQPLVALVKAVKEVEADE